MPVRPNHRVLKDVMKRDAFAAHELLRNSLLFVARNTTLTSRVRFQAQLQLNQLPRNSDPAKIHNRCTETGNARGVIPKWGLCQFAFRQKARRGEIPGVTKSTW